MKSSFALYISMLCFPVKHSSFEIKATIITFHIVLKKVYIMDNFLKFYNCKQVTLLMIAKPWIKCPNKLFMENRNFKYLNQYGLIV